jgi:hypothetical protein
VDAFRVRVRGGWLVATAVAAPGAFALAAAVFDLGAARQTGNAYWLAPSGLFLLVVAAGLWWFAAKRPVVLKIGPEGLQQPITWAAPLPWRDIWRMRCVKRGGRFSRRTATLEVDLSPGAAISYKRWGSPVPAADRWLVRKCGLRIPLQHFDAEVETVLASLERFRPVNAVAK